MNLASLRTGLRGLLVILLVTAGTALAHAAEETAQNVILFIGDGMGPSVVTAGRLFVGGSSGRLAMEQLPVTGFSRTYSSNQFVTDSAAGVTALAAGVKTFNGGINVTDKKTDPTGRSRNLQLISDLARAQGKAVGVVSTSRVTHATPAGYYAHVANRDNETEIASQAVDSGLTLLLGGGREEFHGRDWRDPETGKIGLRKDGKDIVKAMTDKGYTYVESEEQFKKLDLTQKGLKILGLFEYEHMNYELDRPKDKLGEPSLAEMTTAAIKVLQQNPKGYFLMVEGARIDMASHAGEARYTVNEVAALDKAVAAAVALAGPTTLIVVTADHDTGGLTLNGYAPREMISGERLLGNIPNLDEDGKPIAGNQVPRGILAFGSGPGGKTEDSVTTGNAHFKYKSAYFIKGSAAHTAVDVPVMASGPGALKFTGYQNNNELAWKMAAALGTTFSDPVNIENRNAVK